MPAKYDRCIKSIKKKVKKGEMRKTYINKEGKRVKTNPYAICAKAKQKKAKGGKK